MPSPSKKNASNSRGAGLRKRTPKSAPRHSTIASSPTKTPSASPKKGKQPANPNSPPRLQLSPSPDSGCLEDEEEEVLRPVDNDGNPITLWDFTPIPPNAAERSRNGRVQGRSLIAWNRPRMAEKLLLSIWFEVNRHSILLPWDAIAHRLSPGTSPGAIIQYFQRLRSTLSVEGHIVPPPVPKVGSKVASDPWIRGYVRADPSPFAKDITLLRPVRFDEATTHRIFNLPDAINYSEFLAGAEPLERPSKKRSGSNIGSSSPAKKIKQELFEEADLETDEEYTPARVKTIAKPVRRTAAARAPKKTYVEPATSEEFEDSADVQSVVDAAGDGEVVNPAYLDADGEEFLNTTEPHEVIDSIDSDAEDGVVDYTEHEEGYNHFDHDALSELSENDAEGDLDNEQGATTATHYAESVPDSDNDTQLASNHGDSGDGHQNESHYDPSVNINGQRTHSNSPEDEEGEVVLPDPFPDLNPSDILGHAGYGYQSFSSSAPSYVSVSQSFKPLGINATLDDPFGTSFHGMPPQSTYRPDWHQSQHPDIGHASSSSSDFATDLHNFKTGGDINYDDWTYDNRG